MNNRNKKLNRRQVPKMTATATVSKWGNSLGVRIPKDMADSANINQGTEMTITLDQKGQIILTPIKNKKEYSLDELLNQCKPEHRHQEIDFGIKGEELI
ncbi:AbrB/MazE/SpoVT family DNA-binding domain-containing protein [Virgibacillus sp. 6R]|uniref:AbrB/MazE/SpoVT family DNA-binding domain-containing protein n=2 Tax=unclassified Virgibacillus TaxID=2620237 RepID=UPI00090A174C|nr:AbrB/MazE/SpoVT family DNA-binding domain-containing protein [Virgibacillus sp. 6R]API93066.1 hypothetical protein BKP57_15385 [Virgibacillus sp. 6R]